MSSYRLRRRSVWRFAMCVLLTALLGATSVQAVAATSAKPVIPPAEPSAKPPGGFASWDALFAYQAKLNKVAERILAVDPGNPSIVAAPQNRELRVYWKGTVPAKVKLIAQKSDVPVRFSPAAYTHSELVGISRRLVASQQAVGASAKADGSGVDASVLPGTKALARNKVRALAGVPVSVKTEPKLQDVIGRQADVPWFWGGSRYFTASGGACTNGFGLQVPGQANTLMITAGHCASDFTTVTIPGQPAPTGGFGAKVVCADTGMVNYPSGVDGAIYVGPWNFTSGINVRGWSIDLVGNFVFTGGATTGVRFGPVLAVDEFRTVTGDPCILRGPLTQAGYTTSNTCMTAGGDSGGPVYYENAGGAIGVGIMSAQMLGTATCFNSAPSGGAVVGSNRSWYVPLSRPPGPTLGALQRYNVGLILR